MSQVHVAKKHLIAVKIWRSNRQHKILIQTFPMHKKYIKVIGKDTITYNGGEKVNTARVVRVFRMET